MDSNYNDAVKLLARQILQRVDEHVFKQFCKVVCYDESYVSGLAAFSGRSYSSALKMLNDVYAKEVIK